MNKERHVISQHKNVLTVHIRTLMNPFKMLTFIFQICQDRIVIFMMRVDEAACFESLVLYYESVTYIMILPSNVLLKYYRMTGKSKELKRVFHLPCKPDCSY